MRLLAAISHHGLGHLAQAGPVLNELHSIQPDLDLIIWSSLSEAALRTRIPFSFRHRVEPADVGLAMIDAVNVDVANSHATYLDFHRNWDRRVDEETEWLKANRIQGVLSDVAYLPLAAAGRAKIPGVAMCSLNWRDAGEKTRLWVIEPTHPIAEGIGDCIELEHEEMYGERFDVPTPDDLVFISWYKGGEVFRSGCCWNRGYGRVFYFSPGNETHLSYQNEKVIRVLKNAVRWACPRVARTDLGCPMVEPLEKLDD